MIIKIGAAVLGLLMTPALAVAHDCEDSEKPTCMVSVLIKDSTSHCSSAVVSLSRISVKGKKKKIIQWKIDDDHAAHKNKYRFTAFAFKQPAQAELDFELDPSGSPLGHPVYHVRLKNEGPSRVGEQMYGFTVTAADDPNVTCPVDPIIANDNN